MGAGFIVSVNRQYFFYKRVKYSPSLNKKKLFCFFFVILVLHTKVRFNLTGVSQKFGIMTKVPDIFKEFEDQGSSRLT